MFNRPCFQIEFSDGTVIVADAEHQWLTETRASRRSAHVGASIRTTREIAATLRCLTADRRLNHSVLNAAPLQAADRELLVPPYTLGTWLGDGTTAVAQITTADPEMIMWIEGEGLSARPSKTAKYRYSLHLRSPAAVLLRPCVVCGKEFVPQTSQVRTCGRSCGGRARFVSKPVPAPTCPHCGNRSAGLRLCRACRDTVGTLTARLRTIGVLGNKHIPPEYLRASEEQRRALLAGLLDTDGTDRPGCGAVFGDERTPRERCSRVDRQSRISLPDRHEASRGRLGNVVDGLHGQVLDRRRECSDCSERQQMHKERRAVTGTARSADAFHRRRPAVGSVPVRCVEVDNTSHMYLASRAMIPTHNSTSGTRLFAVVLDQARDGQRHLQPGDEQVGDRDAAAVGRGARSSWPTCGRAG